MIRRVSFSSAVVEKQFHINTPLVHYDHSCKSVIPIAEGLIDDQSIFAIYSPFIPRHP